MMVVSCFVEEFVRFRFARVVFVAIRDRGLAMMVVMMSNTTMMTISTNDDDDPFFC